MINNQKSRLYSSNLLLLLLPMFILSLICCASVYAATAATMQTAQGDKYPKYPTINYGTGAKAEQIKHGEYLAKAGDCIACHTAPGGKAFAGGLPVNTPFGTIYGPNITPDKETGIGNWTDEQFDRAMRQGIRADGSYLFPVFPYVNFNKLSKQDVLDIRAYLNAIPAVRQENRPLEMPWPFRVRFFQTFWRLLFFDFHKGEYKYDSRQSHQWNRGAYLVQGLGHCSMCHTPLNFLGAAKQKYFLAGGFVDGFYAPNITSASLKDIPTQKIVDVFLKDELIRGGSVQGPMLEVNHDSLSYLKVDDLQAIATYLKTVKSKTPPVERISGSNAGKAVYEKYCVGCHGTGAGGAPKIGDGADWAPRIKLGLNELYKNAINGIGGMPPKGTCMQCTDKQIQDAVDYIVDQSKSGGDESGAGAATPFVANTSIARGKTIYTQVCSTCHANGALGAPKLGDAQAWQPRAQQNFDVLFLHAIYGYKSMPPKGACYQCSDADIVAAIKYMLQQSVPNSNYSLW